MSREPLVLIVDDNEQNTELVRDVLHVHGFRTLEASSAQRGVELARVHQPDVVLMDLKLPDADGVTALRSLRANPATASIPVVALTAFAMTTDRERFLAAGFEGYLTKPIDIRTVPDEVRTFCQRESQAR
jgi:two-component system cell cycle response regulator DivK